MNNVSSKLYSSIINSKLQEWVEVNNIKDEHQVSFKKDHCTIDYIFTCLALIQNQFANNRILYVALIDFEKAFDSISRKLILPVVLKMQSRESCKDVKSKLEVVQNSVIL